MTFVTYVLVVITYQNIYFYKMKALNVSCRKVTVAISTQVGNLQSKVKGMCISKRNSPEIPVLPHTLNFTLTMCSMSLRCL